MEAGAGRKDAALAGKIGLPGQQSTDLDRRVRELMTGATMVVMRLRVGGVIVAAVENTVTRTVGNRVLPSRHAADHRLPAEMRADQREQQDARQQRRDERTEGKDGTAHAAAYITKGCPAT
ncbi:MAG: hypothetical protein ACOY9I_03805 [Pseudomonadota bacterium]